MHSHSLVDGLAACRAGLLCLGHLRAGVLCRSARLNTHECIYPRPPPHPVRAGVAQQEELPRPSVVVAARARPLPRVQRAGPRVRAAVRGSLARFREHNELDHVFEQRCVARSPASASTTSWTTCSSSGAWVADRPAERLNDGRTSSPPVWLQPTDWPTCSSSGAWLAGWLAGWLA